MTVKLSMLMQHFERLCVSGALVPAALVTTALVPAVQTSSQTPSQPQPTKPKLQTEDTGKILERALCYALETPFNGNFKYSEEKATSLAAKLAPLKSTLAGYKHTGDHNNLYDFMKSPEEHLSVKSVKHKSSWKICPQIIGQTTKKKFCERFAVATTSTTTPEQNIKTYIENNTIALLEAYVSTTFHSPVLFYCEDTQEILLISLTTPINWSSHNLEFLHKKKNKPWNESTTLKIIDDTKEYSLGEFQIHNHRDGVKFRFDLKTLINVLSANFTVTKYN
jgi:hypothetical protein